ncbi:Acyltransferase ChoActase/COT/CPT [Trinorchestia longiramus]|nr:Acyltransferase ChoActase/COT/CPT [Trinorchestia longiramus]
MRGEEVRQIGDSGCHWGRELRDLLWGRRGVEVWQEERLVLVGRIPVDRSGGQELDMSQYDKIFCTCRVPGLTKDSLVFHSHDPQPPRHIIVVHNNHFFKLEVYGKKHQLLSVDQLTAQLVDVMQRSTRPAVPLGLLTTQHRNVWGQAHRTLLRADKGNASNVREIERALFLLCLDSVVPPSSGNPLTDAALMCVHGGGSFGNSGNRWFDKTIQFIVGASGHVGLTYEHSPAEGPPIANLMDHIVDYMSSKDTQRSLPAAQLTRPQRLQFTVPAELEAQVHQAATVLDRKTLDAVCKRSVYLDSLVGDLEMTCFVFNAYGKSFIKSQSLSPDSFIQLAIQLAFYRIHGEPGAHYESASTRKFLLGRTETVRSCSVDSAAFCSAMADPSCSASSRRQLLINAVHSHSALAKQAVDGRGVDRHLLGLKLAAVELGLDVPSLFMDVSYLRSAHMRLSTSQEQRVTHSVLQVPARCEAFMCYGPLVPDGYGCCYNPRSASVVFGVSALNSSPDTYSASFREALEASLLDMKTLLVSASEAA